MNRDNKSKKVGAVLTVIPKDQDFTIFSIVKKCPWVGERHIRVMMAWFVEHKYIIITYDGKPKRYRRDKEINSDVARDAGNHREFRIRNKLIKHDAPKKEPKAKVKPLPSDLFEYDI